MGSRGNLQVEIPICDIPINYMSAAMYLPTNYNYYEFKGMRSVNSWSRSPPNANDYPSGGKKFAPQSQTNLQLENNPLYEQDSVSSYDGNEFEQLSDIQR